MSLELARTFHATEYDDCVAEAHDFTNGELGIQTSGISSVVVVGARDAVAFRRQFGLPASYMGCWIPGDNLVIAVEPDEIDTRPLTAQIQLRSALVHELTHSGTVPPQRRGEHKVHKEALAGMAELEFLDWLQERDEYHPAGDFVLKRAGVSLTVPGHTRYLQHGEAFGLPTEGYRGALNSFGMIAATAINHALAIDGSDSRELLRASLFPDAPQYALLRAALQAVEPGLAGRVESFAETNDGVLQATHAIKVATRQVAQVVV